MTLLYFFLYFTRKKRLEIDSLLQANPVYHVQILGKRKTSAYDSSCFVWRRGGVGWEDNYLSSPDRGQWDGNGHSLSHRRKKQWSNLLKFFLVFKIKWSPEDSMSKPYGPMPDSLMTSTNDCLKCLALKCNFNPSPTNVQANVQARKTKIFLPLDIENTVFGNGVLRPLLLLT